MPVQEATAQVHREFGGKTAGCNPAHRSPPLSMLAAIADEDLAACAMTEAGLTHHDPLAGEIAAAVNKLCRALIRGAAWDVALRRCGSFAGQEGPGNNGGFAPDVLRAALYFVGTSACFTEALERSLAFAGPANYCPVLVGAIAGARWGASAIPPSSLATSIFCPGSGQRQTPWRLVGAKVNDANLRRRPGMTSKVIPYNVLRTLRPSAAEVSSWQTLRFIRVSARIAWPVRTTLSGSCTTRLTS